MAGWGMGRDSASSAQSKHTGGGETARLGSSWGKLGCTGVDGGIDGERGMSTGVDGVIGDTAGVWEVVGGETACFWRLGAELSGWDAFGGCSGVFRCVLRRS